MAAKSEPEEQLLAPPAHQVATPAPARLTIQRKMNVGPAGDSYELEADRVAAEVMQRLTMGGSAPSAADGIQRRVAPAAVRRSTPDVGLDGGQVSDGVEAGVQSARRSGGSAMASSIRGPMEKAFGTDFSAVRLHSGADAQDLSQRIQAKAFTTGNDIFFGSGARDFSSRSGQELLAHELTHVVQQSGSAQRSILRRLPDPTKSAFITKDLPALVPATFAIDDLRAALSDSDVEALVNAIGTARFKELAEVKLLTADVFVHYKGNAAFLKTFVGANSATIDHIKDVDKIEGGQIKGCHDEDNFRAAIAQSGTYNKPKADGSTVTTTKGKKTVTKPALENLTLTLGEISKETAIAKPAGVTVLEYRLRKKDDTAELGAGAKQKTVIKGLAASPAKWADYANEAIWNSIRAKTFDPATPNFAGVANDGGKVAGYYNGGAGVDTFFIE